MNVSDWRSIWHELLVDDLKNESIRKLRWKVMREGGDLLEAGKYGAQISNVEELKLKQTLTSECGRSIKWRFQLNESTSRSECETVLLFPWKKRATVCVSSQVGCAVGCVFCATGSMGLVSNLSCFQIVEQIYRARRYAIERGAHLRNVVFMGMGEPLHNHEAVFQAINWITSDSGFGMSPRHVTVSTIGVPMRMVQMAKRYPGIRIALSLHSADPEKRKALVLRGTSNLGQLKECIKSINALQPSHPIWLEYVMIENVNDSIEDALKLVEFCHGIHVELNVIPYNDRSHAMAGKNLSDVSSVKGHADEYTKLPLMPSPEEKVQAFIDFVRSNGIVTTLRKSIGQSIQAACGQLVTQSV